MTGLDHAIVLLGLLIVLAIGGAFTRRQKDTNDFFLAGRHLPWWAVLLSFLATEISAVTIVSVPATAYRENWEYAQFFIGSSVAKVAVALLFIPAFYKLQVTTIYELLGHRFGRATQVTASLFFFVTRVLASAVRLMVPVKAVALLLGWDFVPTLVLFTTVAILYMGAGGVQAIVWTNVFQAVVFVVAGVAVLLVALSRIDGGLEGALRVAEGAGKLKLFHPGPSPGDPDFLTRTLTEPNIVWIAILNGFVGSLAAFGTDHDLMQRLLAVETRRESQRTLLLSPLVTAVVLLVYLGLGSALFAYFHATGAPVPDPENVLPQFVRDVVPAGLKGLMVAAIVLASLDLPLGALSASFVTDIYRPLVAPARDEAHYLRVSRLGVLAFGVVLGAIAFGFSYFDRILWLAFKITGVTFGSLLGAFLLALLTERRVADLANVLAMVLMAVVNLELLVMSEAGVLKFAWSWLVILGTAGTVLLALAFSWLLGAAAPGTPRADTPASPTP